MKKYNYITATKLIDLLLTGSLFTGLGIFILSTKTFIFLAFSYIAGIIFVVLGLIKLIQIILGKKVSKENALKLSDSLVNIGIGIFILVFPNMPIHIFILAFFLYVLALGITRGVNYFILKANKVRGRLMDLLSSIFYICFCLFLIQSPNIRSGLVMNIIGIYFIAYGSMYLKDFIMTLLPKSKINLKKRHIRISLPVLFQAIIPKVVLDKVNEYISTNEQEGIEIRDLNEYHSDEKADMEVYIHVTNTGFGQVGHVDICIGDEFYSYGNYDNDSVRFNELIGDGVLIKAYKEDYIPFVIKDSGKTLFCFGLKLEEEQKKRVLNKLQTLWKDLVVWTPPAYTGKEDMYASRLLHHVHDTNFYKFKRGKFKTYFVVTTNCVQLADYVLGSVGLDILNLNGIITPGAYYDYLNHQFLLNSKVVIYRKIYK